MDKYNSDETCREALEKIRWPHGPTCIRCGLVGVPELPVGGIYQCASCCYQFSVTAGTIMHDSHLPLRKWFLAIYFMCVSKKGVSALQLKRTLGIGSYRTAWYLCHRIREAMGNDPFTGPTLLGVVEVDETLVGGRKKEPRTGLQRQQDLGGWRHPARRGTSVSSASPISGGTPCMTSSTGTVKDEAEAIYTDELKSYLGIGDEDTRHEMVNHSAEQWVVGDVHTNGIEGVWSLFKRSIIGTFHKMSAKHLDRYLEELEWRFNNRNNPHIFPDTLSRILNTGKAHSPRSGRLILYLT